MIDESNIPVLTDLIEKDAEIELSDLGLGQDFAPRDAMSESEPNPSAKFSMVPALEQEIRRIMDEHLELAWQEIRLAIQQSATDTDSKSES